MITKSEVMGAQQAWGEGIVAISRAFADGGDYAALAGAHIDNLYAYGLGAVLFKPTKAATQQFRGTRVDALSYFVGGHIAEDDGFAIAGWTNVKFENQNMILGPDTAMAMGNYYFTARDGSVLKVEYSFGYSKDPQGALRIILHHSSLPYAG